ncbi:MAG: helix-turn-helix domain-containing protein [Bacillota bacterium]
MSDNPDTQLYPKEHLKCLGKNFRDHRKESGYSIRDVARTANISHTIVFDIEQGKMTPNPVTLAELYDVLGIPFYDDPDVLWPLRDVITEFFQAFHHKEFEKADMFYDSLKKGEKYLTHSALKPHYLFAKTMYHLEFKAEDATKYIEELEHFKEFFIPIQVQSFNLLKGINAFNNNRLNAAFTLLSKAEKMDEFHDLTVLARYYLAFTADKLFKKELSLYYAFVVSEHYSENNNFKRKIDIDFLQAKNMIELGNYKEASDYLNSIHYAIVNFKSMESDREWLTVLHTYLSFMEKDYGKAMEYINQVNNHYLLVKYMIRALIYTKMDDMEKTRESLDLLIEAESDSVPIYQSIGIIQAHNAGMAIDEDQVEKAIDTVLAHPYEIKTIYIHYYTNTLIIEYYESKGDLKSALKVAKTLLDFYGLKNIDETKDA